MDISLIRVCRKNFSSGERTGDTHLLGRAPNSTSGKSRKRKHVSASRNEASESMTDSDNDTMFDPSRILDKTTKIPSKITKYVENFAIQGISKTCRLEVTKNCAIPASKTLAPKSTDRIIKNNYVEESLVNLCQPRKKWLLSIFKTAFWMQQVHSLSCGVKLKK